MVVKVAGYIGGAEPDFSDPPSDGDPNKKVKKIIILIGPILWIHKKIPETNITNFYN